MAFSDARNERDRAETGRNSDNHGNSGQRGTMGQQQDRRNMANARGMGNAAPGVGANNNRGTLAQQQDRINMNRALARSNTAPGVGNYSKAMDDYNNVGQGFFDDPLGAIGRFFGSGFGVGEIDPRTQQNKSFIDRTTASWGVDPIGAALGIGGMFGGPIGTLASGLYNRGKSIAGWQGPMIAFDGNQPVGSPNNPSYGGMSGGPLGGGNGNGQLASLSQPVGIQGVKPAGQPQPVGAPALNPMSTMPAGQFNIPGPSQYGVNLPSYGYFGQPPAQKRPLMMGGI